MVTAGRCVENDMSWLTDERGCGNCRWCGMDMDMDPFCQNKKVDKTGFGLDINIARRPMAVCGPEGKLFEKRIAKSQM